MATIQEALVQGWQHQRAGKLALAEQIYRRVLQAVPDQPEALYLLGTVCQRSGKLDDAAQHLLMAVSLKPDYAAAHNNLGVVMAVMGRRLEAVTHFRHVVRLNPTDPDASNNLGNALRELGALDEAVDRLRLALRLLPDFPDALHNLGLALHDQNKLEDALTPLRQAVRLRSDFAEAHCDLGLVLAKLKRWEVAAPHFEQFVRLHPQRADGHMHLGAVLRELGQIEESVQHLRQAVQLKPDDANTRSSLGLSLQQLGQLAEAEEHLRRALQLDPQHADAHNNLAVTLAQQNRLHDALNEYGEALRLKPDQAVYRRNRAVAWLTLGDFEKGWPEFEWRWKCPGFVERLFSQPRWQGESLAGKTILLYAEQGLGDTLHWIRYAALVKKLGATVIVECPPALSRLLSNVEGIDKLVPAGEKLPDFDLHCPLASLPGVLQTTVHSIPASVPYLAVEPKRDSYWRGQLQALPEFKIGIAWQGNPKQSSDRLRSIPLRHFAPLARLEGVQLFSLQKERGAEQLRELADELPILDLARRLDLSGGAFLDTAAVMENLDLVITCDTAIGHLAGGLGVPVWVALCAAADWRWLEKSEDTPWYPTMRLFRQSKLGCWDDVFERITEEVQMKLTEPGTVPTIPVSISPGELLDKLTILEIKNERIRDAVKLRHIRTELSALKSAGALSIPASPEIANLTVQLKSVNEAIWEAEDYLRAREMEKNFDNKFIDMARSVYRNNDRRSNIKRQINERLSAQFVDAKEHPSDE